MSSSKVQRSIRRGTLVRLASVDCGATAVTRATNSLKAPPTEPPGINSTIKRPCSSIPVGCKPNGARAHATTCGMSPRVFSRSAKLTDAPGANAHPASSVVLSILEAPVNGSPASALRSESPLTAPSTLSNPKMMALREICVGGATPLLGRFEELLPKVDASDVDRAMSPLPATYRLRAQR